MLVDAAKQNGRASLKQTKVARLNCAHQLAAPNIGREEEDRHCMSNKYSFKPSSFILSFLLTPLKQQQRRRREYKFGLASEPSSLMALHTIVDRGSVANTNTDTYIHYFLGAWTRFLIVARCFPPLCSSSSSSSLHVGRQVTGVSAVLVRPCSHKLLGGQCELLHQCGY